MNEVFLLLGSNEGDRLNWLQKAIELLCKNVGKVTDSSPVYETAAWGLQEQQSFYNLVLKMETIQDVLQLLSSIQNIEHICGRQRTQKWGARTLDIDILYFNSDIIEKETLKVPHPFLAERRFTLVPLVEIAAEKVHPALHKTNEQLLIECSDQLPVTRIDVVLKTSF
jgi:2-amino-4-hydroxy-6-hydroxymethyldihydropteridine diphosphokinase